MVRACAVLFIALAHQQTAFKFRASPRRHESHSTSITGSLSDRRSRLHGLFQEDVDELIRSSVETFAQGNAILQSILPAPASSAISSDARKTSSGSSVGYDDIEKEFHHNSYLAGDSADIDVRIYNQLLHRWQASNESGVAARCEEVLARMRYAEVAPDADTYNTLITVWAASGERAALSKAYGYFKDSKGMTITGDAYAALANLVCRSSINDVEKFNLLSEVSSRASSVGGLALSDTALSEYARVLLRVSDRPVQDLTALLALNHSQAVEECLIRALCARSSEDEAYLPRASSAFSALVASDRRISAEVFADYFRAISLRGTGARKELRTILFKTTEEGAGRGVGSAPFDSLLLLYRRNVSSTSAREADEVLQRMLSIGVAPSPLTFEHLTAIWSSVPDSDRVFHLWNECRARGISPTFDTIREMTQCVFRATGTPSAPSLDEVFITATENPAYLSRCKLLLHDMVARGYALSFAAFKQYLRALSLCDKRGSAEIAIELFRSLDKWRLTFRPDLECFEYLMRTFERSLSLSHAENAWNAMKYMRSLGVAPSVSVYESLMTAWVNSRRPDAPTRCLSILEEMRSEGVFPTTRSYNIALRSLTRSVLPQNGGKAVEKLAEMSKHASSPADGESYALVGYALAKSRSRLSDAAAQVEDVYRQFCLYSRSNANLSLDRAQLDSLHRSLISAWSFNRSEECLDKISSLLEAMSVYGLEPHPSIYSTVASAWGTESVHRSRTLLNKLIDRGVSGRRLAIAYNLLLTSGKRSVSAAAAEDLFAAMSAEFTPSIVSYNFLLEAAGRSSAKDVVRRCDDILNGMVDAGPDDYTLQIMHRFWKPRVSPEDLMHRTEELFLRIASPSLASYSIMISGWCNVDVSRASLLVESMIATAGRLGLADFSIYSSLIEAVARNRQASIADRLLRHLLKVSPSSKPDIRLVRLVLEAWSQSTHKTAGEKAQDLLDLLMSEGLGLDAEMLQFTIAAWARQGDSKRLGKATMLFSKAQSESGVSPTASTLRSMVFVYGKLLDSADKAESMLFRLISEGHGSYVDLLAFNIVLDSWGRSSWMLSGRRAEELFLKMRELGIQPDVVAYSSLISALTKKFSEATASKAEAYFNQMCSEGVAPDSRAYTTLITVWTRAKHPNTEAKVRELFARMLGDGCAPTVVTYTAMLSMYSSSKDPQSSQYILDIFDRIKNEGIKLDTAGYSSFLCALGNSKERDAPYQAERVFEEMLDAGVSPDPTAWNILISIWARSRLPGKVEKVEALFKRLLMSKCQPNEFLISTLLKMYTYSDDKEAPSRIRSLYAYLMRSNIHVDAYATKVLIIALNKIMSPFAAMDKIEALLTRMVAYGVMPASGCFSLAVKAEKSPNAYVRGLRYIDMIKGFGKTPSQEVYRAVISAIDSLRWETDRTTAARIALVEEMESEGGAAGYDSPSMQSAPLS